MILFVLTTFLSAFLLFQVQPLISRYILPWFGGAPAVWSTAMLFFQTLLLGGYAYADWASKRSRRRLYFHLGTLLGAALLLLLLAASWGAPLLPGKAFRPPDASYPVLRTFLVLIVSVGLPYFVLSSTSPLLQSWFSFLYAQKSPYWLYALSNMGSFLALISYPLFFEPRFDLPTQARLWAGAFLGYCALMGIIVVRIYSASRGVPQASAVPSEAPALPEQGKPSRLRRFLWIVLPACSTVLLLSVTNQLTQEVAVIPFLWVLPLSLYLFSFTVTFSGEKWYRQSWYFGLLAVSALFLGYAMFFIASIGVFLQIVIYSLFLFIATFVLHGELYRIRPEASRLTSFYLNVSLGGALGGVFVSLIAPLIFKGFWELHVGVMACLLLAILMLVLDKKSVFHTRGVWLAALLAALVVVVVGNILFENYRYSVSGALLMERNFYGVFRVRKIAVGDPPQEAVSLSHGITTHGIQFTQPERRRIPTTYYAPKSGIGLTIENYPQLLDKNGEARGLRVGVVGLGAGTLAAYGRAGDYYRFYEINPGIINLAEGEYGYYSYLKDSLCAYDVIAGDARLSLEHEFAAGNSQNFDILAIDAFSGDSIPMHLLTSEAFAVYLAHLQPDGVLAIHISNRYLDLTPEIWKLAEKYRLRLGLVKSHKDAEGGYAASWALLSHNPAFFELGNIRVNVESIPKPVSSLRLWTDAYSNLFQVLKMGEFYRVR